MKKVMLGMFQTDPTYVNSQQKYCPNPVCFSPFPASNRPNPSSLGMGSRLDLGVGREGWGTKGGGLNTCV